MFGYVKAQITNGTIAVPFMATLMIAGFAPIGLFSWQGNGGWQTFALGLLVAVAVCLVGAVFGFVFGIPRAVRTKSVSTSTTTNAADSVEQERQSSGSIYRTNDNLERVSDWLATVIVGVSLVELGSLPAKLEGLVTFVAPGLGTTAAAPVVAGAIIVYFGIGGFLLGYLWTRLVLPCALLKAEKCSASDARERSAQRSASAAPAS